MPAVVKDTLFALNGALRVGVFLAVLALSLPCVPGQSPDPSALLQQANQERKAGFYHHAIELYETVLELAPRATDPNLRSWDIEWQARMGLATTYRLAGNLPKTIELLRENLAFVRRHREELNSEPMNRESDSLQSLASAYASMRDFAKAAELLQQSLALAKPSPGSLGYAKLTQKLGILDMLAGNSARGEKTLLSSLGAFDEALQFRLSLGMPAIQEYEFEVEVIRWLVKALVTRGQTDTALEFAERGRARAFSALVAQRHKQDAAQPERAWPTPDQMKEAVRRHGSVVVEYSILYSYAPDLPLEFSDYSQTPATDIIAWVIKPTGEITLRRTRLDPPLLIADLVRSAHASLTQGGPRPDSAEGSSVNRGQRPVPATPLTKLYQLLIQPIADLLPDAPGALVTFVSQDALFLVPFAALPDLNGKFLIERYAIANAPSIRVLELTDRRQDGLPADFGGALIVGNPSMPAVDGIRLPDLPGAGREAQAIAEQLGAPVLLGPHATKRAVMAQMPGARVIHLATHGLLDDETPEFTSLAFAPADGEDGFLAVREIFPLQLEAELVVLSACDTAKGKITGDGVLGLARALLAAGASSLIVSLWPIPDDATSILMPAFYTELQGGADKASALRNAMLRTMQRHPAPLHWAAFALMGVPDVSRPLLAALKKGMGGPRSTPARPDQTSASPRILPVPRGVTDYREWRSPSGKGEHDITYSTTLAIGELVRFYREAFQKEGLSENTLLTREDGDGFQMVFEDLAQSRKLIVHSTEVRSADSKTLAVSVRSE